MRQMTHYCGAALLNLVLLKVFYSLTHHQPDAPVCAFRFCTVGRLPLGITMGMAQTFSLHCHKLPIPQRQLPDQYNIAKQFPSTTVGQAG